ncbi:hypothetical protein GGI07_000755 [Coemansia sp. Benny D115]|nr:hypothetical protein GGI07_000755 [Coemansia sp. Benny D115]
MAATLKRGMGRLGLKTGELLGLDSNSKTEVVDEFTELQSEIENRQAGTENVQAALALYTNHLLKKKDSTDNSKQKLYLQENLGSSMFRLGAIMPSDSRYGQVMEQFGQVIERLNEIQVQFINQTKEGWMSSLQRSADEFKEYQVLKKKLETRRSDYESKQTKLQKSRKENVALEDEVRTAQMRYEDTYEDLGQRMVQVKEGDHNQLVELFAFFEANVAYHRKCLEQLERTRALFEESLRAKRTPIERPNTLSTRRSAAALRSESARMPIPFSGGSPQSSLSRASSNAREYGGSQHGRTGSVQMSDVATDDMQNGSMSPFECGSVDGGSRPLMNRGQSDSGASMRRNVPTVAPRRHAPAPPAPARAPTRVLRKALYKFSAAEVGELAFEKGDVVEVTEHVDDGWWFGRLVQSSVRSRVGETGLFPSNYTEEYAEADLPPPVAGKPMQASYRPPSAHRSQTLPNDGALSPVRSGGGSHYRTNSNAMASVGQYTFINQVIRQANAMSKTASVKKKQEEHEQEEGQSESALTFRVLFLGAISCVALSFINQYYWFRNNPISLGLPAVQLLSLPAGWLLASTLPQRKFKTFGYTWSFNPYEFRVKEHALICVFANAGTGTAYALDIVVARRFWIGPALSLSASVLITLSSQLLGYSFSGLYHRLLVEPSAMPWPSTRVSAALFHTLHATKKGTEERGFASRRFFAVVFLGSFIWYFVPGWVFPTLSMLPLLCLAAPKNQIAQQLGDGYGGLGMLALSFDWAVISNAYTGSPLATPWFAAGNLLLGFVLFMWVVAPVAYYANLWGARSLPLYTSQLFTTDGKLYDVLGVISSGRLDTAAYEEQGPVRMSTQFLLMYGVCFMGITSLLTHVALHHGPELWRAVKSMFGKRRDAQTGETYGLDVHRPAAHGPDVPWLWYATVFAATIAMGVAACEMHDLLPWYGFLLAAAIAGTLTLPIGLVEAVSNFQYALGVLTELVAGYAWPGQPTYNASFKLFGYITVRQALGLARDQKLGQRLRIAPREVFVCQLLGTVVAAGVQLGTALWLMDSVEGICTDAGAPFTCRQGRLFYTTMVVWGLLGPQRQFAGAQRVLFWMFLLGVALPLPFWLLKRRFPRSIWRHINVPVALTFIGYMPNAPTHDFVLFAAVCFIFNYVLRRYRAAWWHRYTFVLSAAMDCGVAISGIVGHFALQRVKVNWWGSRDHCPLSTAPLDVRTG